MQTIECFSVEPKYDADIVAWYLSEVNLVVNVIASLAMTRIQVRISALRKACHLQHWLQQRKAGSACLAGPVVWERDVAVLVKCCKERLAILLGAVEWLGAAANDHHPVCRLNSLNLLEKILLYSVEWLAGPRLLSSSLVHDKHLHVNASNCQICQSDISVSWPIFAERHLRPDGLHRVIPVSWYHICKHDTRTM